MYLGLHTSVSATSGTHTGLAKPGQLSQVKPIQPKTKYTSKEFYTQTSELLYHYLVLIKTFTIQQLSHLS